MGPEIPIIGPVVGAVVSFLLQRFFGERRKKEAPAHSPRVSAPPSPPFEYVARPDKEDEVAQLLLADKPVCVTGGPGIGKSCLAMAVAQRDDVNSRFPDGIWWVDAAGMDLRPMCEAVASPLHTPEVARAKSDDEKLGALRTAIAGKNVLVVLDNCENPAASHRFSEEGHRFTLITSQHRPIGPEALTLEPLTANQCLQVLQRTAGRTLEREEEAAALEIVRLLEGLPFAVALAGSQLQHASGDEVLRDLKSLPWPVLTDKARKHRAMKRSLDAACKRLSAEERRLFAALGVFGGPTFDLTAVQAVEPSADAVRMERLVRRSLVRKEDGRYALHPLLRRYARDRLGRGRQAYQRMADHYLALAEALGEDPSALDQLEPDVGNALAAMDWCLQARRWEPAARFAMALDYYLEYRGLWAERRRRLEQGRSAAQRAPSSWLRGACSNSLAILAGQQGDHDQARRLCEEALAIAEELGDRRNIARTQHQLAIFAQHQGAYDEARRLHQDSLAIMKQLGDHAAIARARHQLGVLAHLQTNYEEARCLYEQSLAAAEDVGDRHSTAATKHQLGILAEERGEYEQARLLYMEALAIEDELGNLSGVAVSKHQLGCIAYLQGDYDEARRLYEESLTIKEELGDRSGIASTKHQLGMLAQAEGDYEEARRLYEESLAIAEQLGNRPSIAAAKHQLGTLAQDRGDHQDARRLYGESLAIAEELGDRSSIAKTKHQLGTVAYLQGDYHQAGRLARESLGIKEELGDRRGIALTKAQLGMLAEEQGDRAAARELYREALAIFEQLGSPEAGKARRALERVSSPPR